MARTGNHVDDEAGIQGVAGPGNIVHTGEPGGLGIGHGGVHHPDAGALSRYGGHLGRGGGNGDDHIDLVGNGLVAELLEHGLVILTGGDRIFHCKTVGVHLVKAGGDSVCDLVQRGMVQLLDHSRLQDPVPACLCGIAAGRLRSAGTGGQRQREGRCGGQGGQFFQGALFHGNSS